MIEFIEKNPFIIVVAVAFFGGFFEIIKRIRK